MRTRRFCTSPFHRGPRWLLHTEFHVKKWGDETKTWPAQLQSQCKCCQRQNARVAVAWKRGKKEPYQKRADHKQDHKARNARRRAKYRKQMKDPLWREERREYQRMMRAIRARQRGIPPRQFKHRDVVDPGPRVDAGPIVHAVRVAIEQSEEIHDLDHRERFGNPKGVPRYSKRLSRTVLAEAVGKDPQWVSDFLGGKRKRITTSEADALLVAIDRPDLSALLLSVEDA